MLVQTFILFLICLSSIFIFKAESLLASGNADQCRVLVDELLLHSPTCALVHLVAGKLEASCNRAEGASWHALMALRYSEQNEAFDRRVHDEIIDPAFASADRATTRHLLHGLSAGLNGKLEDALGCFRKSLAEAKLREERIRALQFLVLTALELQSFEAALGYVNELVEYDAVREEEREIIF